MQHASIPKLTTEELKTRALELRINYRTEQEIADELGITQGYVSQLIKQALLEKQAKNAELGATLREMELERCDRMILAWYPKATAKYADPKASDAMLKWAERKHKLLGIEVSRQELSGPNGGAIHINASQLNLALLDAEELMWLDRIIAKAGPQLPAAQGALPPAAQPAPIEHQS